MRDAEVGRAGTHLRQQRGRHVEITAQVVVPGGGAEFSSSVREALVRVGGVDPAAGQPPIGESCRWCRTPAGRQLPRAQRGILRSSQRILVAEKYGSSTRPVRSLIHGSSAWRWRQKSAVRRSCQTMAGATGRPPARSQSTTVSRWLVRPIAVSRFASTPAWRQRLRNHLAHRRPDFLGVVLDPARLRVMLRQLAGGGAAGRGRSRRRPPRGCWSCPDRWPADEAAAMVRFLREPAERAKDDMGPIGAMSPSAGSRRPLAGRHGAKR